MKNLSISLGKFSGIPISIHWTFWILIIWVIYSNISQGQGGSETIWYILFVFTIFACIVLHELGHAIAARQYGISTKSIVLYPIGGVASLEKIPEDPSQELVVAIAGPMVNIIIAILIYIFLSLSNGWMVKMEEINYITADNFLFALFSVNIILVIFNMIPAFPMDGGRVLRALLALKMDRVKATEWAVNVGRFFTILFVLWGISNNPFLIFIGLLIYMGAQAELNQVRSQHLMKKAKVNDVVMKDFTLLAAHDPISTAVRALLNGQEERFLVEKDETIVGVLNKVDIMNGLNSFGEDAPISKAMQSNLVWLAPNTPLQEAKEQMMKNRVSMVPVGENGQLLGVLDLENLNEFLMIKNALKRNE